MKKINEIARRIYVFLKNSDNFPLLLTLALAVFRLNIGLNESLYPVYRNFGDVGQWVDSGDRILSGQLPYRDFMALYGPLLYFFTTLFYKLAGANWFAATLQLEVISPLICLFLIYYIAQRSFDRLRFKLLFIASAGIMGLDRFFWTSALRVWLPLTGLVLAAEAFKRGQAKLFSCACALCGLCLFVSFETGCAAILACGLLAVYGWFSKYRDRKFCLGYLWFLAPVCLMLLIMPRVCLEYFATMKGLAAITNWYGGLLFPPFAPVSWSSIMFYSPFLAIGIVGTGLALKLTNFRKTQNQAEVIAELALWLFSALLLRTLLGRSDYFHCLFILPPLFLVWIRFCQSLPSRHGISPVWLAVLWLFPFWVAGFYDLDRYFIQRNELLIRNLAPWTEEGVTESVEFIGKVRQITALIHERVRPDEKIISLPISIYAHWSRRGSALGMNQPEQILALPDGPKRAIAELERHKPPVAVIDQSMIIHFLPAYLTNDRSPDPLQRRLTWATPADEAITRELRAYLMSNYKIEGWLDGVLILTRKPAPEAPWEEVVIEHYEQPFILRTGEDYILKVPLLKCDELRLMLKCSYPLGLGSLAKTYANITIIYDSTDTITAGALPVPPAQLNRDLRILTQPYPIKEIIVNVLSPGAFNPSPKSIILSEITFVSRETEGKRETVEGRR